MPTATGCRDEWLLRVLEARGLVSPDAAREARQAPYACVELSRRGLLTPERLAEALWEQYRIPFADPADGPADKLAAGLMPESLCRRHTVAPLRLRDDRLEVLTADPLDTVVLDEVMAAAGRPVRALFALPDRIERMIAQTYGSEAAIFDLLRELPEDDSVEFMADGEDEEAAAADQRISTPVIRLADHLIVQAVRQNASDIHVEQEESATLVRYRIDGVLRTVMSLPKHIGNGPLVSRIKIMADLDLADRRRAQDGRAKLRVGGRELGLRVSTVPTAFGEKAVLRILDARQAEVPLEALGFRPEARERIASLAGCGQGLVLVTGPTGSGKTTTLYAVLNRLKSDEVNIVTVEDPIEYRLPGINQIQVHEKAGLGFAAVLRSVLRQDPDIILVGEIRDKETADIAFQAAQTGHLVFSTLHTNDAVSTINRLVDMGVERYKIAPALAGVVSQRLVRRVCPDCAGKGCPACENAGLRGRIALAEVLDLRDPEARQRLGAAQSMENFEAVALEKGWLQRIADDARWHLRAGETTAEEAAPYLGPGLPSGKGERLPSGDGGPLPAAARRSVLIVDDCPDNRGLARDTLKADGYALAEAAGGDAALKSIQAGRPDLVLLDLMMPGLDGFAVIKRLRADPATARLPVIVLTAMSEAESQALSLELGADDYLAKPFHPRVLRARVQALFRRQQY
ncbi:MAG: Flp pilus assembly complex ATPase component TadA [Elusimicrobia bacterium]|nr:Flp pilus assembly complex ATPase component TadA [Elusimicrobiota bacterium]